MRILVTGGAGYIGSFAVRTLLERGYKVTIFDSLENGKALNKKAGFIKANLKDRNAVFNAVKGHQAVMHFAGYINVAESVENPKKYYENNLLYPLNLLEAMTEHKVPFLIFSSTAAVYGMPQKTPIKEEEKTSPINPYGASKLMFERALQSFDGIKHIALRYFNVAGASPDGKLGESHNPETHLIPNVLAAASKSKPVCVFGNDYSTKDGTCIRDYIHVQDLVDAHILSLERLMKTRKSDVFNLGNQTGYSVLDVIRACERATGKKIKIEYRQRRPGDPPVLVASSQKIKKQLGWKPKFGLDEIAKTAWKWNSK